MKKFPTLYMKNINDKIRIWNITVYKDNNKCYIKKKYGFLNGKIVETEPYEISHNGKISCYDKALTKANYEWVKKKKQGFQENISNIENNKLKNILPMLAYKLEDNYKKIIYPACVQKKLDGFRCLSYYENNELKIYSKGKNLFTTLDHIENEIKLLLNYSKNYILDGELYINDLKLRKISSILLKKKLTEDNKKSILKISFNIFDLINKDDLNMDFKSRYNILKNLFLDKKFKYINLVNIYNVNSYIDIEVYLKQFLNMGYEGIVVRNYNGIYNFGKKSKDVLVSKQIKYDKFKIIGSKKGSGQYKDSVIWKLECKNNKEKSFWSTSMGTIKNREKLYQNRSKYINRYVKVKYFDIDSNGCVIRNPVVFLKNN